MIGMIRVTTVVFPAFADAGPLPQERVDRRADVGVLVPGASLGGPPEVLRDAHPTDGCLRLVRHKSHASPLYEHPERLRCMNTYPRVFIH